MSNESSLVITDSDAQSLAGKLTEFGRALPAGEQMLLGQALSRGASEVQGYSFSWGMQTWSDPHVDNILIGLLMPAERKAG